MTLNFTIIILFIISKYKIKSYQIPIKIALTHGGTFNLKKNTFPSNFSPIKRGNFDSIFFIRFNFFTTQKLGQNVLFLFLFFY